MFPPPSDSEGLRDSSKITRGVYEPEPEPTHITQRMSTLHCHVNDQTQPLIAYASRQTQVFMSTLQMQKITEGNLVGDGNLVSLFL